MLIAIWRKTNSSFIFTLTKLSWCIPVFHNLFGMAAMPFPWNVPISLSGKKLEISFILSPEVAENWPVLFPGRKRVPETDPDFVRHGGVKLKVCDLDFEGFDGLAELYNEPGPIGALVQHVLVPVRGQDVGGTLRFRIESHNLGSAVLKMNQDWLRGCSIENVVSPIGSMIIEKS